MYRKLALVSLSSLLLLTCVLGARAQSDEYKFELGGQYTAIKLERFAGTANGLGGRFGYNFNEHLALDTEFNFFPETALGNEQVGQKTQAFVGIKAGARAQHAGLFVKARPGIMFIGELTSGFDCTQRQAISVCRPEHNNFALDVGGVAEVYPSAHTVLRLDVGDTIVRLKQVTGGALLRIPTQTVSDTTHNLQISVGFSYRF